MSGREAEAAGPRGGATDEALAALREGRIRERAQTRFYRVLAGAAEVAGDGVAAERLNDLLADEQHHLSRMTARILELGGRVEEGPAVPLDPPELADWETRARAREAGEVAWYEDALARVGDRETRRVLAEILDSERHHLDGLAGKWMPATGRGAPEPGAGSS